MPKKSVVIDKETFDVITQAEAAANDVPPTPLEKQATDQLAKQVHDAMANQPTPSDENDPAIAEIEEARNINRNQLIIAEDHVKTLKARQKELDEQWLDAIKTKEALYKRLLQTSFNF